MAKLVLLMAMTLGLGSVLWQHGGGFLSWLQDAATCPPAAKSAMLFTTAEDRSSVRLKRWTGSAPHPKELDEWVIWELIPGIFEVGADSFRNMFDALPQVATYAQKKEGWRMYSLSTIESDTFNETKKDGGIKGDGWFATPPKPGAFDCNAKPVWGTRKCLGPVLSGSSSKASTDAQEAETIEDAAFLRRRLGGKSMVDPMASPNIHIMRIRGHTIAMGGAGAWTELSRDETTGIVSVLGVTTFNDTLEDTLIHTCNHSPHTMWDAERNLHVGVSLCVGILPHTPLTPTVKVWTMSEDPATTKGHLSLKRDVLAVVPSDTLFDLHDFGLTDTHIVYVETSPQFESAVLIANALLGRLQMLQTLCDWQDEIGHPSAHIVVMERATGQWKRYQIDGPVGKVEHVAGSYDQPSGDGMVIDFLSEVPGNGAAFPTSSELVRLLHHTNESAALLNQRLIRCILPTGDSQNTSSSAKCREIGNGLRFGPFVTMNSNFYRKPYKFAYLTFPNMSSELGLSDGVVKFDVDQERIVASSYSSFAAGRYVVNEPRFIPRGDAEDDALLVVTMHDTLEDRSHQAVFDTQDMSLIGTYDFGAPNDVDSAGRMRVAFHGMHCPVVGDGPCLRL